MNKLIVSVTASGILAFASASYARTNNITAPVDPFEIRSATGVDLDTASGTYKFEVGTFGAGWSDTDPLNTWYDNFTNGLTGSFTVGTWTESAGFPPLDLSITGGTSSSALSNVNFYVFGYLSDFSEILVLENSSWTFSDFDAPANIIDYALDDAGTSVVGNAGTYINASTYQFAQSVPEPSTYVLMALGLGAVFVATRRRK